MDPHTCVADPAGAAQPEDEQHPGGGPDRVPGRRLAHGPLVSHPRHHQPPTYFGWLVATLTCYCVVVQTVKTVYIRRFGRWF
ncbi:Magnesium-translocating P-type ATPase [Mycolicibacterium smegmatis MC2 155]|uniref:Magnesium-translocating P-type ATPase n=1 Tax=Mycolicibacterium smegmatis (strain ATCC 700084 / mc(2)155) TaxID=246196 RepID=I7GEK5_MYCS2|nr:Magnesium-translocating P-type ATPase [Mycolicibacterium smegmatis MC2 155]